MRLDFITNFWCVKKKKTTKREIINGSENDIYGHYHGSQKNKCYVETN